MTLLRCLGVLLVLGLLTWWALPGVEGQVNCQSGFLSRFLQCVSNSTLNPQHFLWLSRDGNMGSQPPDIPAFTQSACMKKDELSVCFKGVIGQFRNMTCGDADMAAIDTFYRNVVNNLDNKCTHPCRDQLLSSMSQCLTTSGVNASLFDFLTNVTIVRDMVLGDSPENVTAFCTNRTDIMQCMSTKTALCPDTPEVLMAAGIDMDSLNNTLHLLCDNKQLYLHGVMCSANRSAREERCQDDLLRQVTDLDTRKLSLDIDRDVYAAELCRARLDHVRCDLNALSGRDVDTKCPDEVVGLRREQECALIPALCRQRFEPRVNDSCDPLRFLRDRRPGFVTALLRQTSGAGTLMLSAAGIVSLVVLSRLLTGTY